MRSVIETVLATRETVRRVDYVAEALRGALDEMIELEACQNGVRAPDAATRRDIEDSGLLPLMITLREMVAIADRLNDKLSDEPEVTRPCSYDERRGEHYEVAAE